MTGPPEIYVFDAYGTLFDFHSATRKHANVLGGHAQRLSEIWRAKQLEYTWFHAARGTYFPFRGLTREALMFALDTVSLSRDFAPRLLEAYQHLEPFPEVASCLRTLKVRGARLAILSNADTDMLDDLADAAKFRDQLEFLISVRVAGTFKPAPAVYELATEVFGVPAGEMTFVSSNRWDAAGAKASGFQTVWVNRTGAPVEYPELQADRVLRDLSEL